MARSGHPFPYPRPPPPHSSWKVFLLSCLSFLLLLREGINSPKFCPCSVASFHSILSAPRALAIIFPLCLPNLDFQPNFCSRSKPPPLILDSHICWHPSWPSQTSLELNLFQLLILCPTGCLLLRHELTNITLFHGSSFLSSPHLRFLPMLPFWHSASSFKPAWSLHAVVFFYKHLLIFLRHGGTGALGPMLNILANSFQNQWPMLWKNVLINIWVVLWGQQYSSNFSVSQSLFFLGLN